MQNIADNLARVREQFAVAAADTGRDAGQIKLIAVSKNHAVATIDSAVRAGLRSFGENTTQEALQKIPLLRDHDIEWHFIGHLQSNKAKFIPEHFQWLHSLDSLALAQRLSRLAQEQRAQLNVLIEINITSATDRHGVATNDLFPLLDQLLKQNLPAISLRGLMTVGPHPAIESESRAAFAALRSLRDQCRERSGLKSFTELSMGMSSDYAAAIKEGSTMVRIGTALFGTRDHSPE